MDKETLSNYGWIVICVLVLAVMIALAGPFGTFVAGAVKSTTAGLFGVNQNALGAAGIDIEDQAFPNCEHLETEIRNATADYSGDTCCRECGAVLGAGIYVIPEGGTYYVGVTNTSTGNYSGYSAKYEAGDPFPEIVNTGDIYYFGDYEYRYNGAVDATAWKFNESQNGWGVYAIKRGKSSYGKILESINGKPITNMNSTFSGCSLLTDASNIIIPNSVVDTTYAFAYTGLIDSGMPTIPNGVKNMHGTFTSCKSLIDLSGFMIPSGVTSLYNTFWYCSNLKIAPNMINAVNVKDMTYTFYECTSLVDASTLNLQNGIEIMLGTFYNCKSLKNAPSLPNSVIRMHSTFYGCASLETAPIIPSSVADMDLTFSGCTSLIGTIVINTTPPWGKYGLTFNNVDMSKITLAGSCDASIKQAIANTGKNGSQVTIID